MCVCVYISWERNFRLWQRFPSNLCAYRIHHIFCARGPRSTGSWIIMKIACLFEKFFNMVLFTFSSLRRVFICTALCPSFNKVTIVTRR